jgi:hypothetical protein
MGRPTQRLLRRGRVTPGSAALLSRGAKDRRRLRLLQPLAPHRVRGAGLRTGTRHDQEHIMHTRGGSAHCRNQAARWMH